MNPEDGPIHIYYDYCNLGGVTSIFKQRIALMQRNGVRNRFIFHFFKDLGGRKDLDALLGVETKFSPIPDFHAWCRELIENNPSGYHILIDQPEVLRDLKPKTYTNLVYEVHTSLEKAFKRMRGVSFNSVSRVICPSQWLHKKLTEILTGFDPARIFICHNFIDDRRFVPLKLKKDKNQKPIVLWIGKLNSDKNIVDALDIMRRLKGVVDFTPVIVTGGGMDAPIISNFLWRCISLDIGEDVRWICDLSNAQMPKLLNEVAASGGVMLSTSKFESFGLAALEALSCGVPVVAAAVGGLTEVVRDNVDGRLFQLGDNDTAAEAIIDIIQKPKVHAKLSKAAITSVERFDPTELSKSYFEIVQRRIKRFRRSA